MTSAFLFINSEFLFTEEVRNKLKEIPEIVDIYIAERYRIAKVKINTGGIERTCFRTYQKS